MPQALRLLHPGGRHQAARDQAVARMRFVIVVVRDEPAAMQRTAFGRGDDEGGGASLRGAGQFDDGGGVQCAGGDLDGATRLRAGPFRKVPAQHRDAQVARAGA
ncbi:hypothetical protein G6F62_014577 [Rhizopus arrhizus]|nr:hypothetical protein G6F62_014577 [Rhizopus arrhizus]